MSLIEDEISREGGKKKRKKKLSFIFGIEMEKNEKDTPFVLKLISYFKKKKKEKKKFFSS